MPMLNHKKAWIAALCLIIAPSAARAQVQDPRFDEARAARNAGDLGRAIQLIEEIDAQYPNDPTTLRLLGSAHAARGDYILAIATLERARLLAPQDQDIALALGRAMIWSGRLDDAEAIANEIGLVQPDNVELPELRRSIDRARRNPGSRPRISLGHTRSRVKIGNSRRNWTEAVVAIDAPIGARTTVAGELGVENRGDTADTRFAGRIDHRLASGGAIFVGGSVTANPTFREDWSLRAGGETPLLANVALMVALRHADYGLSNVTVVEPGSDSCRSPRLELDRVAKNRGDLESTKFEKARVDRGPRCVPCCVERRGHVGSVAQAFGVKRSRNRHDRPGICEVNIAASK